MEEFPRRENMPQQVHKKPWVGTEHFTHINEHTWQWQKHMECGKKKCSCQLGAVSKTQAVCRAVRSSDRFLEWPFFSRVLEHQKNNLTEYKVASYRLQWGSGVCDPFPFTSRGDPHSPSHHQPSFVFLHLLLRNVYAFVLRSRHLGLRLKPEAGDMHWVIPDLFFKVCGSCWEQHWERELFHLPSSLSQTCTASHICTSTVANAPPWWRMLMWIMGEDVLMLYPVTWKMAVHELGQC